MKATEHTTGHYYIIPSSEQLTGRIMHKINEAHEKNVLITMMMLT